MNGATVADDSRQASAFGLGDRPRYDVDSIRRGMSELSERWKNRLSINGSFNLAEEYVRGRLCILIQFDTLPLAQTSDIEQSGRAAFEGAILPLRFEKAIGAGDCEVGDFCGTYDRGDSKVLVRVVQATEGVERFTMPGRKSLGGAEGGNDILARCFYSFAGGFKAPAVASSGKFEVAVLRSAVASNEFPRHMVESGPEIVDSIAYYHGECFGHWIAKADADGNVPGFVVLPNRQV